MILTLGVLAGVSHQARAEDCPAAPDIGARVAALLEKARGAPDAKSARPITDALWELWAKAPNEQAQAVLDRGMRRRAAFDLLGAISEFDRLIAYCPTYAEGYNQRAFAHFIRGLPGRLVRSGSRIGAVLAACGGDGGAGVDPDGAGPDARGSNCVATGVESSSVVAGTPDGDPARHQAVRRARSVRNALVRVYRRRRCFMVARPARVVEW